MHHCIISSYRHSNTEYVIHFIFNSWKLTFRFLGRIKTVIICIIMLCKILIFFHIRLRILMVWWQWPTKIGAAARRYYIVLCSWPVLQPLGADSSIALCHQNYPLAELKQTYAAHHHGTIELFRPWSSTRYLNFFLSPKIVIQFALFTICICRIGTLKLCFWKFFQSNSLLRT